jgi:trans-aconitate methyltransferase
VTTQIRSTTYTFGDSEVAARRLELLAQAFAASSSEFLNRAVTGRPRLAVDLGCGPGYSTAFLSDALDCDRVVGLDNSERFIALAPGRSEGNGVIM